MTVRGIDWFLRVKKSGDDVGVFLAADPEVIPDEQPRAIKKIDTYDFKATFTLLADRLEDHNLVKDLDLTAQDIPYFKYSSTSKGIFLPWNEFMDKFVGDDNDEAYIIVDFQIGRAISLMDRPNPTLS